MQVKKYISKIIQQNINCQILTKEDKINYKNAKICHTCQKELSNDTIKIIVILPGSIEALRVMIVLYSVQEMIN